MRLLALYVLAGLVGEGWAASAADWRGRSIYQVFTDRFARTDGSTTSPCDVTKNTYCGGTWRGIQNKLDYIKNMGFTAIWISPITAQVPDGYHGYYQSDLYTLNSNFGTPSDLKSLSAAVHAKGMYLMVDVVPNHMGWRGCHDTVNYSTYRTLNRAEYFHSFCPLTNMANQTEVEKCWISGANDCGITMPDLNTNHATVARELGTWIQGLVKEYGIDGLRIDSVKNVNKDFFPPWCRSAAVFCMGEVSEGLSTYTYPYQSYLDSILDYPLYYSLTRVFTKQANMTDLVANLAASSKARDPTLLGRFLENHDNPRFAGLTGDEALARNAAVMVVLGDGIPLVYQGQELRYTGGDDPGCREAVWGSGYPQTPLSTHIALLNRLRTFLSHAPGSAFLSSFTRTLSISSDASTLQLRKSSLRLILTNSGTTGSYTLKTSGMGFKNGETVVEVLGCKKYMAGQDGEVSVDMDGGPKVLVEGGGLWGSGVCGF
ncbi:putative alpha-amylase [Clohesyomyces aquaticus]|uniref:alpha-amylase n=1 Tax=Clohesyomyces aquaticus TaxID=1231657 RepID=A0A1Y1ZDJ3_9PLEO|nr:putative alpha-amylase [Clohesyomyces aquaticus]